MRKTEWVHCPVCSGKTSLQIRRLLRVLGVAPRLPIWIFTFEKFRLEKKDVAYNHGREERKWRLWKEADRVVREMLGL